RRNRLLCLASWAERPETKNRLFKRNSGASRVARGQTRRPHPFFRGLLSFGSQDSRRATTRRRSFRRARRPAATSAARPRASSRCVALTVGLHDTRSAKLPVAIGDSVAESSRKPNRERSAWSDRRRK